jgi:hypothetical protein
MYEEEGEGMGMDGDGDGDGGGGRVLMERAMIDEVEWLKLRIQ